MTSNEHPDSVRLDPRDMPKPGRSVLKFMGKWAAVLLAAAWCLFLLTCLALYGVLLPRVGAWKPEIESRASAALGVAVRIGGIEAPSTGWVPALVLSEVALLDEQGRVALRLPKVSASLSPRSLLSLELRFEQLLIEDAALEIRRDARGRIRVAGLALDDESASAVDGSTQASDWLLAQGEFVIRRGQVRWIDEFRGASPLVLQDVDLVLRNGLRRHDWRLDATPPPELGQRWSVRGRFRHGLFAQRSDWRGWVGELYAEWPQADVDALRPYVDLPAELLSGQGAARLWLDVDRGRLRAATADVALREVRLRWPGVAEAMVFSRFDGRLAARQEPQAVTFALQQVGFTTGDGKTWPASDMKLVLRHAADALRPPVPAAPAASGAAGRGLNAASDSASQAPSQAPSQAASQAASDAALAELNEPMLPLLFDGLEGRVWVGGEFTAAELDLGLMASVAARAPLGAVVHRHLAALAPQGRIRDMKASWDGPVEDPSRYRVSARLDDLQMEPGPAAGGLGRPGLRGAGLQLEATEKGGRADLRMDGGELMFPGWFEQPQWMIQALQARLSWQFKGGVDEPMEWRLSPLTLRTPDLEGEVQGSWRGTWAQAAAGGGELDLSARIPRARAAALHRVLPASVPVATRDYLRRAVKAGQLQEVSLRVKGNLQQFPFDQPGAKGEFRVGGQWRDGTFLMVPEEPGVAAWPEATKVEARLRVVGQRLEFSEVRGRLMGVDISRTSGQLDWRLPAVPLAIDLQARGPAQDFLRYVRATPINEWTSRVLATAQASGTTSLALKLDMPLVGNEPARVRGQVQLGGNDLRLSPTLPPLQAARGRVDFSERGFNLVGGTAQLLGGEVSLEGGIAPGAALRLNLQGTAQVTALRASPELTWLGPIPSWLTGQAPYRISVGVAAGQLQWVLTSPLTGLGLNLPAPLYKPASANWTSTPLRVELTGLGGAGGTEREQVEVQLGRLVQGKFVRQAATGAVVAGALGIGTPDSPALPRSGIEVSVQMDRLDVDEWRAWRGQAMGHTPPGTGAAAWAEGGSPTMPSPSLVRLKADSVLLMGRQLDGFSATAVPLSGPQANAGWRVDLQASQLAGRIEWRPAPPGAREGQARVLARLSRLSIPPAMAETVDEWSADDHGDWPALDVVVDDFELRGRRLGRLEVQAEALRAGRDWQLTRFALANADAALTASGSWAASGLAVNSPRRTAMDFELDLKDSGGLLNRLGLEQALRGGVGRVAGRVSWRGSPLSPDPRTMQGQLQLDVRSGQFLKVDPGAARLLGVLSLQSLPRRLVLDFRDVFQEGFPFDTLVGDVTISAGVASTNNLRMRGVQAAVLMEGSADINHETQDLRVLVVPEINAGTASLAYATINPALGLGTFLAQLFLRRPLMVANTREFSITGTWADPKVERLQRTRALTDADVDRAVNGPAAPGPAPGATPPPVPASVPNPASNPRRNP